jgi:hypothetical protein
VLWEEGRHAGERESVKNRNAERKHFPLPLTTTRARPECLTARSAGLAGTSRRCVCWRGPSRPLRTNLTGPRFPLSCPFSRRPPTRRSSRPRSTSSTRWAPSRPTLVRQHAGQGAPAPGRAGDAQRNPQISHREPESRPPFFPLPLAEVVIAPSALHIEGVKAAIRPEVAVAVQDIHTAKVRRARAQSRRRGVRPSVCASIIPSSPSPSPPLPLRRASAPTLALTPWTR